MFRTLILFFLTICIAKLGDDCPVPPKTLSSIDYNSATTSCSIKNSETWSFFCEKKKYDVTCQHGVFYTTESLKNNRENQAVNMNLVCKSLFAH